jgi:hypothetical protein
MCHLTSTGVRMGARVLVGSTDPETCHHRIVSSRSEPRDCRYEGPSYLREATFDLVDEIGAPAEPLDAEFLASLEYGFVDCRTVFGGSVQLKQVLTNRNGFNVVAE